MPIADANVAEGDIYQLGQYGNGSMCYAVDLTRLQDQALPALQHIHPEAALVDMRAALMTAAPPDIAVAGQAIALAQWHKVCPNNRQPYRAPGLPASFSQLQQKVSFKVSARAQGGVITRWVVHASERAQQQNIKSLCRRTLSVLAVATPHYLFRVAIDGSAP